MIRFLANFTQPDFYQIAYKTKTSQFVTIPFSHYVEFSRWCLQYTKFEFKESGYAPIAHILPALKVRMFGNNGIQLSNSNRMIQPGTEFKSEKQKNKKGATSLPLLVLPNGEVLKDSWEIAKHTGLKQEMGLNFQKLLDEDIGPLSRQLAYYYMLKKSNSNVMNQIFTNRTGWLWTIFWYMILRFVAKPMLIKEFQSNNIIELNNCKTKLTLKISEIDIMINNKTTKYFGGDTPSIDDFALASLFAPLISPQEYALGQYKSSFNLLEKQDKEYLDELNKWRKTETGVVIHLIFTTLLYLFILTFVLSITIGKYCLMLYWELRTKTIN